MLDIDDVGSWIGAIVADAIRPETETLVSEWADNHRRLDGRSSAEPGRWRTARTPYLRDIMNDLSPSSNVEKVVFMKGAQVGATEAGNNWLGFTIDRAPAPIMLVLPTVDMAKRSSKNRIQPLIDTTPSLRAKISPARERDSGNTILHKEYPGGILMMTGANSSVGLRSAAVRYLFCDEIDGYPGDVMGEGDPVALATKRTDTFARRKIFLVSTPTVEGISRIENEYNTTDQRKYYVPCPQCEEYQVLEWPNVRWSDIGRPPERAAYVCPHHGCIIEDHHKGIMLAGGEWRATADGAPRVHGYHLSGLYSPHGWYSWGRLAADFVAAKSRPARLRAWTNTALGETWKEAEDAPEWRRLHDRRESYTIGRVPHGGLLLTAGVDVQKDRLECSIWAWGRHWHSWLVDHLTLSGPPSQQAVWQTLAKLLDREVQCEGGGILRIARMAVDTGGHHTSEVHAFANAHAGRVMAVKGNGFATTALMPASRIPVTRIGRKSRGGGQLWPVGTNIIKSQLYDWLKLEAPTDGETIPDGYVHIPEMPEEYFRQLTAERLTRRATRGGGVRTFWEATRNRNEALDCRVYATAAALAEGFGRWGEVELAAAEQALGMRPAPAAAPAPDALDPPPPDPTVFRHGATIRSAWLHR